MNRTQESTQTTSVPRSGNITFYHPRMKGGGAAVRLELRLNREGEESYDCFFLEMAHQKTSPSSEGGRRIPATFDWENKATVKLDFRDVCELLTVLEGRSVQAGNGRQGIYHEAGGTNTLIAFKKGSERDGFMLGLSRRTKGGQEVFKGYTALSDPEAIGMRCLLQSGLFYMTLGASLIR